LTTDETRLAGLHFAASLRGATDRETSLSWMADRGYIAWDDDLALFALTEKGRVRADALAAVLSDGRSHSRLPLVVLLAVGGLVTVRMFRR
jgi:hypothetical protein